MKKKSLAVTYSNVDNEKFITRKEYIGQGLFAAGNGLKTSFGTFTSLITARLLGFSAQNYAILSTIILVLSFVDILDDIIVANVVDRKVPSAKWGKFKPFIYVSFVPLMLVGILNWLPLHDMNPNLPEGFKMAYVVVIYLLNDIVGTFSNAATNGLNARMTPSGRERGVLATINSIVGSPIGLSSSVVMMVIPMMFKQTSEATLYFIGYLYAACVGSPMALYLTTVTKERIIVEESKPPKLRDTYKDVLRNRPILALMISDVFAIGSNFSGFTYVFICRDILSGVELNLLGYHTVTTTASAMLLISILCSPPTFISMLAAPFVRKYVNDRALFIGTRFFSTLCYVLIFITCLPSLNLTHTQIFYRLVTLYAIHGFTTGFYNIIPNLMTMDAFDYGEWKTGRRTEATVYVFRSLLSRIAGSINTWIGSFYLIFIDYPTHSSTVAISKRTENGLIVAFSIIPAIFYALSTIPLFFYNYVGDFKKDIQDELEIRRNELKNKEIAEVDAAL